jgi:hypothetical protein
MNKKNLLSFFVFCVFTFGVFAQGLRGDGAVSQASEGQLPLKKVFLFMF